MTLFAQQLTMNGSKWLRKTGSNAIQSSRNSRFFLPLFNPSISICHPSPGFFNQHLLKLRQKHWGWQILKVVHGIQGRERCGDFPRLLSEQNQKGGPFWIFGDNLDGYFLDNLDGYSMVIHYSYPFGWLFFREKLWINPPFSQQNEAGMSPTIVIQCYPQDFRLADRKPEIFNNPWFI